MALGRDPAGAGCSSHGTYGRARVVPVASDSVVWLVRAPQQPSAQFVGGPDDDRIGGGEGEHVGGEGCGTECGLQGWQVDDGGGEREFEGDAHSSRGLEKTPIERSAACSVRAAKAVPI